MLTLDALLFPLPYLLHPFLPSLISTLLLIYITYFPSQTNSTHPAYSPTLATVLYTTRAWNILTILLALARTFHTWLSNIEGLERDGLGAVWHEILAEGKMRPKRMERRVVWQEEVVLVTGGMGGLGKELVRVLGERGCGGVGVVDLVGGGGGEQEGEEEEGKGKGKTKMSWYKCDVGDAKSVEGLRERVGKDLGAPTILINNAGITHSKPLLELTNEEVERTFRVNTFSHFNTIRTFLPDMLKREQGGTIVTVSSILGYLGCAGLTDYTSSKAALLALHTSLLSELAFMAPQAPAPSAQNGPVSLVLATPGQLQTPLFAHLPPPPLARFAAPTVQPRELAEMIVKAIEGGGRDVRVSTPMYAGVVAAGLWGLLPTGVARLCRGVVGVDAAGWGGVVERRKSERV